MADKKTTVEGPSDAQPQVSEAEYADTAARAAELAKDNADRAAEVKAAREGRKGKKLQYSVVLLDEKTGDPLVVGPSEFNPNDFRSYDPSKPHSVNGVPQDDSEIAHLLDQIKNPNAWA